MRRVIVAAQVVSQLAELGMQHGTVQALVVILDDQLPVGLHVIPAALIEAQRDTEAELKVAEKPPGTNGQSSDADVLLQWLNLHNREAELKKWAKEAEEALAKKVLEKYGALTEQEIKTLVVDDKWLATMAAAVQSELDRVSQTLTGRIRQLAERYATPLPQLLDEVSALSTRVDGYLKKMGAIWN